jgi:hypothetical protein
MRYAFYVAALLVSAALAAGCRTDDAIAAASLDDSFELKGRR